MGPERWSGTVGGDLPRLHDYGIGGGRDCVGDLRGREKTEVGGRWAGRRCRRRQHSGGRSPSWTENGTAWLCPPAPFASQLFCSKVPRNDLHSTGCTYIIFYRARCLIRLLTVLSPAYTLPGGDPRIRETIASRATLIFWNEPMIWIFLEGIDKIGRVEVLEYIRVRKHNTCSTGIFNRKLGLPILACDAPWTSR